MHNYLYLEPCTYINSQNGNILLINTVSGEKRILKSSKITNIILKELNSSKTNLIEIKKEYSKDSRLKIFIMSCKETMCGDIINSQSIVSLPYICKTNIIIEEDRPVFNKIENINEIRIEYLSEYLQELTIYLGSKCEFNCHYCDYAYRQYLFCHKFNTTSSLSFEGIKKIIAQIKNTSIEIVNIIGGNLFNSNEFYNLIENINQLPITIRLIIHSHHLLNQKSLPSYFIHKNFELLIFVDDRFSIDQINMVLEKTALMNENIVYSLIINSNNSYRFFDKVIYLFVNKRFLYVPIYNEKNFKFFQNNIFINQDDLLKNNYSMKQLQLNQIINTNYFGKLYLLPDGTLKTNMNSESIGNVLRNKIKDTLFKELMGANNWKLVRKNVAVCSSCIFQDLCPPISNYEFVLNRNNLCNIN